MINKKTMQEIKYSQRINQTINMMKLVANTEVVALDGENILYGNGDLFRVLKDGFNSIPQDEVTNKLYEHEADNTIYHLGQISDKKTVIARYGIGPITTETASDYQNLKLVLFNLSRLHEEIEPVMDTLEVSDIPFDITSSHQNYEFLEIVDKLLQAFKTNDIKSIDILTKLFFDSYLSELKENNRSYVKYYIMLFYGFLVLMMIENGYDLNFTGVTVQRFITKLHSINRADQLIKYVQAHIGEYLLLGIHEVDKPRSKYVKDTLRHLQENIDEHISMQDMIGILGISKRHLSRMLLEETGKSFTEISNDFKIEHAKVLLRHTRYNMVEISSRVGYNSQGYFSRLFKRKTGMTPLQFRNS